MAPIYLPGYLESVFLGGVLTAVCWTWTGCSWARSEFILARNSKRFRAKLRPKMKHQHAIWTIWQSSTIISNKLWLETPLKFTTNYCGCMHQAPRNGWAFGQNAWQRWRSGEIHGSWLVSENGQLFSNFIELLCCRCDAVGHNTAAYTHSFRAHYLTNES